MFMSLTPQAGHMLWVLPSLCQSVLPEGTLPVLMKDAIFITWLDSVRIYANIRAHHVSNIRT